MFVNEVQFSPYTMTTSNIAKKKNLFQKYNPVFERKNRNFFVTVRVIRMFPSFTMSGCESFWLGKI